MENQQYLVNRDNGLIKQPPLPINAHNQVVAENHDENTLRMQSLVSCPQELYSGNVNINDSDGPLVLSPLPHGHTFVVTSNLMQILTARGLFSGLPSEDRHANIAKMRSVCKSCVVKEDLNMNIIGLPMFPLSLTEDASVWFTGLCSNSIYTWDQL